MNLFMRFPNAKTKALVLNYDDGTVHDKRLIEILKPYGIKATFNINSGLFGQGDRMTEDEARELYTGSGHEVSAHTLTHSFLDKMPLSMVAEEVLADRRNLERIFGGVVRGMAYPYGVQNDAIVEQLKSIGTAYSRVADSTNDFRIPTDWLRLTATCHHNHPALMELVDKFLNADPNAEKYGRSPLLFHLWGHSYEFDRNDNWHVIEEFAKKIAFKDEVWYATTIQIYDYVKAYNNLIFNVECSCVFNPSGQTIWFEKDGVQHSVGANETIRI